ncbi:phosphotransferase enzyme family protein [Pseudonocardia spinosispora]|uniref:phosphotransferase enzyme family protein n=1 Tax=Pseudonocardia spinosispora TaxID=103441 RepID=UPI0004195350|nr:phosphotransferase [Pseudonocardia spinosispora]
MTNHDLSEADAVARLTEVAHQALEQYDVAPGCDVSLLDLSENATFRVTDAATGTASILRVHRLGYHDHADVVSELRWLDALREEAGVRTPHVLPTVDGEPVATVVPTDGGPERMAVRFEFLSGGEPPETRRHRDFETLGELTARMHRHARQWPRPAGFSRFSWNCDAAFGPGARWGQWRDGVGVGPEERAVLGRLEDTLRRRLAAFGSGPARWGLIHADLRLANLLVDDSADDADAVSVIDFDHCGNGWYLYDLGTAVSFFEHQPEVPELIDRWLRGYRRVLPLPADDEAEIWTFVLFRRLLLVAWIGSHTGVDFARGLGADYTADSCALAEQYLSRHT